MIRAIATVDERLGLAAPGKSPFNIPWRIPEDLRRFRRLTEGGTVLMGRSTYETLEAPLPNRRNAVASHTGQVLRQGFELVSDAESFLRTTTEDIWIIGGAALYASTLSLTDEVHLTHVQGDFHCDRFFPAFADKFVLKQQSDWLYSDPYTYRFAVYENR